MCSIIVVHVLYKYFTPTKFRHSENLLFDSTNGDLMHVDFSCLFDQGDTLGFPELVPFRLTHNMLSAMV